MFIVAWYFLQKTGQVYTFPRFGNFHFEGSLILEISILRDPSIWKFLFWGIPHFRNFETGMKQTGFFGGLTQFFVPIFPSSQSSCTWHGYFKKTWVLARFFWLQGPLIQSSAAPQGSPPPTQQIKIQMQISWVGWSTNHTQALKMTGLNNTEQSFPKDVFQNSLPLCFPEHSLDLI